MIAKKTMKKDERAVAPVIAEILMVAIVVILAAVIGAFVFGTGSHVKMTYNVAATAGHPAADTITVTYVGGQDADYATSINVSVNGVEVKADGTAAAGSWPTWDATTTPALRVGVPLTCNAAEASISSSRTNYVIATARFSDGGEQVILNTYV